MKIELAKLSYNDLKDYDYIDIPLDPMQNMVIRSESQFNYWKYEFERSFSLRGWLEIKTIKGEVRTEIRGNYRFMKSIKSYSASIDKFYSKSNYRGD